MSTSKNNSSASHPIKAPGVSTNDLGSPSQAAHSRQWRIVTVSLGLRDFLERCLGSTIGSCAFFCLAVITAVSCIGSVLCGLKSTHFGLYIDCRIQLIPHVDSHQAAEQFKRDVSTSLQAKGFNVAWQGQCGPHLRIFLHHTAEGRIDFQACHEVIKANGMGAILFLTSPIAFFCTWLPAVVSPFKDSQK